MSSWLAVWLAPVKNCRVLEWTGSAAQGESDLPQEAGGGRSRAKPSVLAPAVITLTIVHLSTHDSEYRQFLSRGGLT